MSSETSSLLPKAPYPSPGTHLFRFAINGIGAVIFFGFGVYAGVDNKDSPASGLLKNLAPYIIGLAYTAGNMIWDGANYFRARSVVNKSFSGNIQEVSTLPSSTEYQNAFVELQSFLEDTSGKSFQWTPRFTPNTPAHGNWTVITTKAQQLKELAGSTPGLLDELTAVVKNLNATEPQVTVFAQRKLGSLNTAWNEIVQGLTTLQSRVGTLSKLEQKYTKIFQAVTNNLKKANDEQAQALNQRSIAFVSTFDNPLEKAWSELANEIQRVPSLFQKPTATLTVNLKEIANALNSILGEFKTKQGYIPSLPTSSKQLLTPITGSFASEWSELDVLLRKVNEAIKLNSSFSFSPTRSDSTPNSTQTTPVKDAKKQFDITKMDANNLDTSFD